MTELELDDIEKELDYDEARDMRDSIEQLLGHDGWSYFTDFLNRRAAHFQARLLQEPVTDMQSVALHNQLRGQLTECRIIPQILAQVVSDLTTALKKEQENMAAEEEND